jgi:3-oxosteroid 1-dehydrogenase
VTDISEQATATAGATMTCDVLVVGSGGGALTGAFAAASAGLATLVIEKTGLLGGTTAYSGAGLWLPDTQVQRRAGVEDSAEDARTYLRAIVGDYEVERQETYISTAGDLVALLESDPNIAFEWRSFPDYFPMPGRRDTGRAIYPVDLPDAELGDLGERLRPEVGADRAGERHREDPHTGGRALVGRLLMALRATGRAELLTETSARALVVGDGRVVGVEAVGADGEPLRIHAERGVLLAAGGMEGDAALRTRHRVPGRAAWTMGPRGANTGDLVEAAVGIGADTTLLDEAWWCTGIEQPDGSAGFMVGVRGGLMVDGAGARFVNECLPYDRTARAMIEHGTEVAHLVFDSSEGGIFPAGVIPDATPAEHLAAGTWVTAPTVEGIAQSIGVPAAALAATVAEFNRSAAAGVDAAFHRGEDPFDLFFCPPGEGPDAPANPALRPIGKPPFYAARVVVSDLGTKGGLRTDIDARVLRADGSPIEGLYAAGNTSASLSGHAYPSPGVPLGTATVFSYRAIQHMIKEPA